MLEFRNKYAKNFKYSQNGEEGILKECIKRIGMDFGDLSYKCMEFGAHNGRYCSNTRLLIDEHDYSGIMIEADPHLFVELKNGIKINERVCAIWASVNNSNINGFLSVINDCDVISIDTDGDNDYNVFNAMIYRPKIVIVEINSGIKPDETGRKESYAEMVALGLNKNYFLLCHTGNLIFVDEKYKKSFPEIDKHSIYNRELYFDKSWL